MRISIYGAGYVGLVSGICFAELGFDVCCIDVDESKINALKQGKLPIYEEQLESLLHKLQHEKRIQFTTDFKRAVDFGVIQMIAVGTPSKTDGSADLQYVEAVATQIGNLITDYRCIVNKSTVPVGTAQRVNDVISQQLRERNHDIAFDVVSNPEFLREGRAVKDCLAPDRIVIGVDSDRAREHMMQLYRPLTDKGHPLLSMDPASAELTKYAANAFLATKVSFINEMSQIAERFGANIHAIKKGIGADSRINEKFLNAGCGFGGSCFPKDVSALQSMAKDQHYEPHILNAVLRVNEQQQALLFRKISNYFNGDLRGKTIALWGLAFKPNTDDVRCASSRVLMEMLWQANVVVRAYDPLAMELIRRIYPEQSGLILCDTADDALVGSDALVVVTEWDQFKNPDFYAIKQTLNHPALFDGRNLYAADAVKNTGLTYFGIGC